jgi:hypothetical protein
MGLCATNVGRAEGLIVAPSGCVCNISHRWCTICLMPVVSPGFLILSRLALSLKPPQRYVRQSCFVRPRQAVTFQGYSGAKNEKKPPSLAGLRIYRARPPLAGRGTCTTNDPECTTIRGFFFSPPGASHKCSSCPLHLAKRGGASKTSSKRL